MGRSISQSTSLTATVLGIPLGGYADVFGKGRDYRPAGSAVSRVQYPDMSAAFPVAGAGIYAATQQVVPSGAYTSIAYGNGKVVAVGSSGALSVSADGVTWSAATQGNYNFAAVAFGNGVFVAITQTDAVTNEFFTSPDGLAWTQRNIPVGAPWTDIAYGGGLFVAVAGQWNSSISSIALTSPDGINWTQRAMPSQRSYSSVAYGGGKFVAVCSSSAAGAATTTISAYSADGINWVAGVMPSAQTWGCIAYGGGQFVALCGKSTTPSTVAATSPDGINWTQRVVPSGAWQDVTYGNGIFAAVAGTNQMATSADGITWLLRTLPTVANVWMAVAFLDGLFVAINGNGAGTVGAAVYVEGATSEYLYLAGTAGKFVRVA